MDSKKYQEVQGDLESKNEHEYPLWKKVEFLDKDDN
jgi:hypothetical protein